MNGIEKAIRKAIEEHGEPLYTTADTALRIGKSIDTLRRWLREERVRGASYTLTFGKLDIHLFTERDVQRLREYAKSLRPGRPSTRQ